MVVKNLEQTHRTILKIKRPYLHIALIIDGLMHWCCSQINQLCTTFVLHVFIYPKTSTVAID